MALPGNAVLIAGGWTGSSPLADTQDYTANNAATISGSNLTTGVGQATTTMMGNGLILLAGGTKLGNVITNAAEKSGPYFYVRGKDGAKHQLQFTSFSGDWYSSMTLNMLYDATSFSTVYDWIGGVGSSLRATVRDAQGTLLGSVTTAHKGTTTLSNADGSQQVTENRNLVNADDIAFLDEKVVIAGPLQAFYDIFTAALLSSARVPSFINEWFITTPTSLFGGGGRRGFNIQQQSDLWQAITDVEQTSLQNLQLDGAGDDKWWMIQVKADSTVTHGGDIRLDDCWMNGSCGTYAWYWVDAIRSHATIDHHAFPQFFVEHRRFLDQIVSWIQGTYWHAGWLDSHPGSSTILPYGFIPYWDAGTAIFDNGNLPGNNFIYTALPGTVPWGNPPNCHSSSTYSNYHGEYTPPGTTSRRDSAIAVLGNPTVKCAWEASQSFKTPSYALAYGSYNAGSFLCTAPSDHHFFHGDGTSCICGSWTEQMGVDCYHGCVHQGLGGIGSDGYYHYFANLVDSPASPIFFPFHAWTDFLYKQRLDCE